MLVTKRKIEGQAPVDDGSDKILVFFLDNEKMNEMDVKRISATMIENDVLKSIVIIKGTTQVSRRVSYLKCFDKVVVGPRGNEAMRN